MILNAKTKIGMDCLVKDSDGNIVTNLLQFNTETKESILLVCAVFKNSDRNYFPVNKQGKFIEFGCILPELKAYNRETGEEIL